METRAERTTGGWSLNGTKRWITNGSIADVAIVWAKVGDDIRGFIVETNRTGFQAPEIKKKLSLRASVTSDLIMDDVFVPDENLLPKAQGLRAPLKCLDQARFGIAWGAIGAAMAVYECAVDYTRGRTQFGQPIATFQLVQEKLANMLTEITKAQLLAWRLGRLKDEGKLHFTQTSMAKTKQRLDRAGGCAHGARPDGSQRDHAGVSRVPAHVQSGVGLYLRRYSQHSHADPRRTHHGVSCVQIRRA